MRHPWFPRHRTMSAYSGGMPTITFIKTGASKKTSDGDRDRQRNSDCQFHSTMSQPNATKRETPRHANLWLLSTTAHQHQLFVLLHLSMFSHTSSVDVQLVITPRMEEIFLRSDIAVVDSGCPSRTHMIGIVGVYFRLSETRRGKDTYKQCQRNRRSITSRSGHHNAPCPVMSGL
jgi:hypothetical protein